jgi:hypothetical protein
MKNLFTSSKATNIYTERSSSSEQNIRNFDPFIDHERYYNIKDGNPLDPTLSRLNPAHTLSISFNYDPLYPTSDTTCHVSVTRHRVQTDY